MAKNTIDSDRTAELEKINLEIQELRFRFSWEKKVGRFLTISGTILAIITFFIGIYEFRENNKQEYQRRFWEKRLEVYSNILAFAAKAATIQDQIKREEAFKEFEAMYHGSFILIADDSSALAAKNFYNTFIDFRNNPKLEADLLVASRNFALTARSALAIASENLLEPGKLSFY
jgi:hypothetical protein